MDSLITAAARSLAQGDVLGALKRVALRDDPPALAIRGMAMAQLGEHPRARELLRRAARGFGPREALARARCLVAEAEVALAMRDLSAAPRSLAALSATLAARGDRANAMQAQLIAARRLLLLGRLGEAATLLEHIDTRGLPPSLAAVCELTSAEISLRSLRIDPAEAALARAQASADLAGVPTLLVEVSEARAALDRPAARLLVPGGEQALRMAEVAALLDSGAMIVDGCRRGLQAGALWLPLARRPVLFTLACGLAAAWPADANREALIDQVFRTRRPDDTHRARLRVEIGRLRGLIAGMAQIEATARGFRLAPHEDRSVILLSPPFDGDQASLVALLSDGAAWSTSALALALRTSQRTIQRALADLEAAGRARSIDRARVRRWLAPSISGFTTILLLPASLPID